MRNLITKLVLTFSIGVLGLIAAADAQTKTGRVRPPVKTGETAVAVVADAGVGSVNIESIRGMLVGLGYDPIVRKAGAADTLQLVIRKDGWTYDFDISVSGNGRKVWFSVFFNPLRRDLSASELAGLLEANFKHGPAHFTYNPITRRLNLGMSLDNRGINADVLRLEVDAFTNTIRQTVNQWDIR